MSIKRKEALWDKFYTAAPQRLRRSVELNSLLPYGEPWSWMQSTRHAPVSLLLEQGHMEKAEAIYRSDLGLDGKLRHACQHPDNIFKLERVIRVSGSSGRKARSGID